MLIALCALYTPGGLDFESGSYQATFLAGKTTTSVFISITNDTTAELTEDLSAVLTIPPTAASQGITKGAADTATIDITDDDPVEVVFNQTQCIVNESDKVVTLTLNADKAASFEYTVEVETQDGTATGNLEWHGNIDFYKLLELYHSGLQIYHSSISCLLPACTVPTVAGALGWHSDHWLMFKVLAVIHSYGLIGHARIVLLFLQRL